MTVKQRIAMALMCAVVAGSTALPLIGQGAEPATAPAAAGRTDAAIEADLKTATGELQNTLPSIEAVTDPTFRKTEGAKVIPPLKKTVALLAELVAAQTDPAAKKEIQAKWYQFQSILVAFGDADTITSLKTAAAGKDADQALMAKSSLALGNWWGSANDAKAQDKQLDDFIALAKANPTSDDAAITLMLMANLGAASDDLKKKAFDEIKTMTGPAAKSLQTQIAMADKQQQEEAAAMKSQEEMVGKPLTTVAGRTSTDGKFAISSLQGKVVLVDFWATWCGPCVAGLPEVKGVYKKYHDKGFEIVGVSCDSDEDALNSFTKENDMPWLQLHDKAVQSGDDYWHPLTHQYGIMGIPTMFLVDKKGVLRYVDAREDLESKVQKLLAEK